MNIGIGVAELIGFEETADWRRRKYKHYPEDTRNFKAATLLDALASDVVAGIKPDLEAKVVEAYMKCDNFRDIAREELRAVGFWSFPNSAEEILESIVEQCKPE